MKTCREHSELDLSINFKNFGKFFKIDILAIKISFLEYFFVSIIEYISTQPGIYYCKQDKHILLKEILFVAPLPWQTRGTPGEGSQGIHQNI
jgi:hypothetical protein